MTERELKKYALVGLLVQIEAEEKKLNKTATDKERIKTRIETMKADYFKLLEELQQKI